MLKHLLLISFFAVFATAALPAQTLSDFRCGLFPGRWKMETKNGLLIEEWQPVNKAYYQGKSYKVENGDTVILETMQLKIVNNSLVYAPTVNKQNEGKEILFYLNPEQSDVKTGRFVFENLNHDFPQRIIYKWTDRETLVARIEGMVNGKLESSETNYKRVIY